MNIGVFASGRGSNFEAILGAIQCGTLPAHVTLLVSNRASADAMTLARSFNIPALHLNPQHFPGEREYCQRLLAALTEHRVDLIALAGYLKKLPAELIARYRYRIVNIHPALLPKFGGAGMYGIHVHEAVLAAGETVSGASVHFVDEEYDTGAVILQRTVPVLPNDTPEALAARVLAVEHELYPEVLRAFAENRIVIDGPRVWIQPPPS